MWFKYFASSIGFLTIFPVKGFYNFNPSKMLPFFPLAGVLIGIVLGISDFFLVRLVPVNIASFLDVSILIFITGALHVDGLADTADGLFSHKDKKSTLEIMKDSRIGTMGVVTIIVVLGIKWLSLCSIGFVDRFWCLVIVPAFSRFGMVVGTQLLPYCRDKGLGKDFVLKIEKTKIFFSCLVLIPFLLILGNRSIIFILNFVFTLVVVLFYYKKKLNCITGDMLGALNEVLEAMLFFSLVLKI